MAKIKRNTNRRALSSPIDSRYSFILLLGLAFLLVIIVSAALEPLSIRTRAALFCKQPLPITSCTEGVGTYTKDKTGCLILICPFSQPTP